MTGKEPQAPYVLGIDLGSNSIGWACIKLNAKEQPMGLLTSSYDPKSEPSLGVRIFPMSVENYGQGEKEQPLNFKRRSARQMRRQLQRRVRRIKKSFYMLQKAGLLPAFNEAELAEPDRRHARDLLCKRVDAELHLIRNPEALPYELRARALDEPLTPVELGRAFFHMAQRRGFKSNRKSAPKKGDDDGKVLGDIKSLREAMAAIDPKTGNPMARTLGEHFYNELLAGRHVRRRFTARAMYETEFDAIVVAQRGAHAGVLTDKFVRQLRRALFFQRPLKSARNLIGTCELENGEDYTRKDGTRFTAEKKRRAPVACIEAMRFRMLQGVNNLRVLLPDRRDEVPLTPEQRAALVKALQDERSLTWAQVKKAAALPRASKFNLERGGEKSLKGDRTNHDLGEAIGHHWWNASPELKSRIVTALRATEDEKVLRRHIKERSGCWGELELSDKETKLLVDVVLEDDYASLSRAALKKVLPLMEEGKSFPEAKLAIYGDRLADRIMDVLPPTSQVFGDIRNPTVTRALTELRHLVNAIMRLHGKPHSIHIELARDLKQSKEDRNQAVRGMRDNEQANQDRSVRIVREAGISNPRGSDLLRVRLWDETGGLCPYTLRQIPFAQLFGHDVDIEHIIPFSRSLDDGNQNKTLCYAEFNRNRKHNQTPFETYGGTGEWDKTVAHLQNMVENGKFSRGKLRRFMLQGEDLEEAIEGFTSAQLNDTRHASVKAKEYLARLYGGNLSQGVDADGTRRIFVGNGQVTAFVRRALNLNGILSGNSEKTRDDHRHHAVDAVAIALTSSALLKQMSDNAESDWKRLRTTRQQVRVDPPWETCKQDVDAAIQRTLVSHRVSNRVRGALHAETAYSRPMGENGYRAAEGTDPADAFVHIRKPVSGLSIPDLERIVDPHIREAVRVRFEERKAEFNAELVAKGKRPNDKLEPSEVFDTGDDAKIPWLKATKASGKDMPIRKVRIRVKKAPKRVGRGVTERFMDTSENHHIAFFADKDKKGNPCWRPEVVSVRQAADRLRSGADVYARTAPGFLFALDKGAVFSMQTPEGLEILRLRGFTTRATGNTELYFARIRDARASSAIPSAGHTIKAAAARRASIRPMLIDTLGCLRSVGVRDPHG